MTGTEIIAGAILLGFFALSVALLIAAKNVCDTLTKCFIIEDTEATLDHDGETDESKTPSS